jgi:hypothetical protein
MLDEAGMGKSCPDSTEDANLTNRIHLTLHLADRRGYGLNLDDLSRLLICGSVPREVIKKELSTMPDVSHLGAVFCLKGSEELLPETGKRLYTNGRIGKDYETLATGFAEEFISLCPFIRCIAIAGSVASGGFCEEDDIDYNIFVEKGSKYTVYLFGILLSFKYSFRHRKKPLSKKSATPFLSKLICINVIWEDWESLPYKRRDMYMAYELLRQKPVFGIDFYRTVLDKNRWVTEMQRPYALFGDMQ